MYLRIDEFGLANGLLAFFKLLSFPPSLRVVQHLARMTLPAEVPLAKRALQAFFFAPLFCLTISGVVFGFAGTIIHSEPLLKDFY